jgi:hypothetical protein
MVSNGEAIDSTAPVTVGGGEDIDGCATLPSFDPTDNSVIKKITRDIFHPGNKISREEAIDFSYCCNLGVNLRSGKNDSAEETLKNIIKRVRSIFEGYLKGKVEDAIRTECSSKGMRHQGHPINRMSQLAAAWAEDDTLKENLWHCVFGSFSRQLDWENEFEKEAMEHLSIGNVGV